LFLSSALSIAAAEPTNMNNGEQFVAVSGTVSGLQEIHVGAVDSKQVFTMYTDVETGAYREDKIAQAENDVSSITIYEPKTRTTTSWSFINGKAIVCADVPFPAGHCAPLDCMAEQINSAGEYQGERNGLKYWKLTESGIEEEVGIDPKTGLLARRDLAAPSMSMTSTWKVTKQEEGAPVPSVFEPPAGVSDMTCMHMTPPESLFANHVKMTLFLSSALSIAAAEPTNMNVATSVSVAAFVGMAVGGFIALASMMVHRRWKTQVAFGATPLLA